jgi:hypothetical protein
VRIYAAQQAVPGSGHFQLRRANGDLPPGPVRVFSSTIGESGDEIKPHSVRLIGWYEGAPAPGSMCTTRRLGGMAPAFAISD